MRLIFILASIFFVGAVKAQDGIVAPQEQQSEAYGYWFGNQYALREGVKFDKTKSYSSKDSLALFIADSIEFHKIYYSYHQQLPHTCQNRFYKSGVIGIKNETLIPFIYDGLQRKYEDLLSAVKENVAGVIDNKGKVIIPFVHYGFHIKTDKLIACRKIGNDSILYFYNSKGSLLFSKKASNVKLLSDKYVLVEGLNQLFKGVVDLKGNWILEPNKYNNAKWVKDDFICVVKNENYGVINLKNKQTVIPFEYSAIEPTECRQFIVCKKGRTGVVDYNNHLIFSFDSGSIWNWRSMYVFKNYYTSESKLMKSNGETVLTGKLRVNIPEKEKVNWSLEKAVTVIDETTRLMGLYREDGFCILPISYTGINYNPRMKLVLVSKEGNADDIISPQAAADMKGKMIVPFSNNWLSFIESSPNLLLSTNRSNLSAFVNANTGEIFTNYSYQFASYKDALKDGYIAAQKGFYYSLIAPEGRLLTEAVYDSFSNVTEENKQWFEKEIVAIGGRGREMIGITKNGEEVQRKPTK